jgi:hypothetical protein
MYRVAQKVHVVISDDLDGSADAETIAFGWDGVNYEIDLSAKNRTKLDKAFAPYVQAARRVSRSRRPVPRGRAAGRPGSCPGLGKTQWPAGLRARPDQRTHHAAV